MILRETSCLFFRFVSWSQVLELMIYQLHMAIFEILTPLPFFPLCSLMVSEESPEPPCVVGEAVAKF